MIELDRIVEIARLNFERVHAGLDHDLAAAATPEQARQVRENRDRALSAYLDLIGRSLDGFTGDWDRLSARTVAVAAATDAALATARDQADRLRIAAELTTAVGDIAAAFGA